MKLKGESAKAGLYLNIKKTKIMTTEEICSFNINNEDIEIVKDFAYLGSVINNRWRLQPKRRWRFKGEQ